MNTECSITEHKLEVFCVSWRFVSYFITESWHSAFNESRFCFTMVGNLKFKKLSEHIHFNSLIWSKGNLDLIIVNLIIPL